MNDAIVVKILSLFQERLTDFRICGLTQLTDIVLHKIKEMEHNTLSTLHLGGTLAMPNRNYSNDGFKALAASGLQLTSFRMVNIKKVKEDVIKNLIMMQTNLEQLWISNGIYGGNSKISSRILEV